MSLREIDTLQELEERHIQLELISNDLVMLNEISYELLNMTREQDEMITSIEEHVEKTIDEIDKGNEELIEARKYQMCNMM